VALAVGGLVLQAGGDTGRAILLTLAMAGFQVSIGTVNDIADRHLDAHVKAWKPLPAGRLPLRVAKGIAFAAYLLGVGLSALAGLAPLVVGLVGHGVGLAYDLRLKRAGWGWLAFTLALPLVPVFAWLGAGAGLPPRLGPLAVLAVLAGLQLAVANELADLDADAASGGRGLAVRLGRRRARGLMVMVAAAVLGLAGLTLGVGAPITAVAFGAGAAVSVAGTTASTRDAPRWRWLGWQAQALGLALVALAWIPGAAG
jgi:4-hydroxybenzoate polyprenyltransferase